ncbi:MAG: hypothetical protein QGG83_04255, partial [Candidatus Woesearchaeota archaeon]|nr:hypothetical protein [Candidatus Woesearchaeota archaeon]
MSSWLDSQNLDLMAVPFRIGSMPFEMYQKMLGTQRRLMTMGDLLELGWRSHSRVMNPLPPELQEEISQSFAHVWEDGLLLATRQTGREIQYGQEPDQVATLDRVYTPGSLVEMRESYFNLMTGREKKGKVMSMANDSLQRLTSTPLEAEALFATGTQT